jgi:hypothetical protein
MAIGSFQGSIRLTRLGKVAYGLKSLLRAKMAPAQRAEDQKLVREITKKDRKLDEKNQRLKRFRERVEQDEREIERLRSELLEARESRPLPAVAEKEGPIFFLLGRGKSGTTWLMNTLNSHPDVLCRGEGRFFERSFERMVALENLQSERLKNIQPSSLYSAISSSEHLKTWIERSVWTGDGETDRHLRNLNRLAVNYFLSDQLSKTEKKIVGDKTTFSRGEVLDEISTMCPEAKVIHLIRDGRDVAVSMMHHMWNHAKDVDGFYDLEPEELEKRDKYRSDPQAALAEGLFVEKRLRSIARAWAHQVSRASDYGYALLGENYMEVKYEDLLARTEKEIGKLLRFLGADFDQGLVRNCIEANRFEKWAEGREKGQEESSAFYRKGVAGDWRNVFTEKDKSVFKEAAGEALINLGYEKDRDW